MKPLAILCAVLLTAACSSAESSPEPPPAPAEATTASPVTMDPNAGTHRYRYVESVEHPDNNCSTSAVVGDELSQTVTFDESTVTVVFKRDDLPEGSEPGRREYNEQIDADTWRDVVESTDGSVMDHTIEFTDVGVIMTTLRDGNPCFYSIRERIDG
jgi:ABC-type transport system substrate-binding protein